MNQLAAVLIAAAVALVGAAPAQAERCDGISPYVFDVARAPDQPRIVQVALRPTAVLGETGRVAVHVKRRQGRERLSWNGPYGGHYRFRWQGRDRAARFRASWHERRTVDRSVLVGYRATVGYVGGRPIYVDRPAGSQPEPYVLPDGRRIAFYPRYRSEQVAVECERTVRVRVRR